MYMSYVYSLTFHSYEFDFPQYYELVLRRSEIIGMSGFAATMTSYAQSPLLFSVCHEKFLNKSVMKKFSQNSHSINKD